MNLADRLRERADELKFKLVEQWLPYYEYLAYKVYIAGCLRAADKREARRIAAGDPTYVRNKNETVG